MGKTQEPSWRSALHDGPIDVRDYDAMVVAEVVVSGERYDAIKQGFRILANYIFGQNTAQTKIAMTAPVTQQQIPMTAPVTQQPGEQQGEWKIRFVMPANSSLATLPVPRDPRIKFIEIPAHQVVALRFSGFNTDENLSLHLSKLMLWLREHNIAWQGEPTYAFYDPPWTLPFLKRNEVMINVAR